MADAGGRLERWVRMWLRKGSLRRTIWLRRRVLKESVGQLRFLVLVGLRH